MSSRVGLAAAVALLAVVWVLMPTLRRQIDDLMVPRVEVAAADVRLSERGGVRSFDGRPFSGLVVERDSARVVRSVKPYLDGRLHGTMRAWYADGARELERPYRRGVKVGRHVGFWPEGTRRFEYEFVGGESHGVARDWFADGTLFKEFHYRNGREAGSQRMWYEDGSIRANYVMRDGRRYGLMGSKACQPKAPKLAAEASAVSL